MQYIQVTIGIEKQELKDIIIALLENISYEGFEEQENSIIAFVPGSDYDEAQLKSLLENFDLSFTTKTIEPQNWNAQWEANFQPVIVENFCTIRAGFHRIQVDTPYEIVITPKMSFGTGHHATTQLMMMQMSKQDLKGKAVLDFGTGTGILAILAEKLGAKAVLAIDNDEWSYENTRENIAGNNCLNIEVVQGSLEVADKQYDTILANINRHILLHYMNDMYSKLAEKGTILMSGLLKEDRGIVVEAALSSGFKLSGEDEHNNWIVLIFNK